MNGRVLVAGFATRHVAQSAFHAGYSVCAVDHFCDQDLYWYTTDCLRFDDLDDLPSAIEEMSNRYRFDMLVVTSGAEEIPTTIPLCGTPRKHVMHFLDKLEIQHFFEGLKVPVPRLVSDGEFPAMLKPRCGAGGWRNAVVRNEKENTAWEALYPDHTFIRQEVVNGIPASVCCVADGTRARAIAVNEQILRGTRDSAFGFCGSVTPFFHQHHDRMITIAEKIAGSSGCTGTVGIDFVAGGEIYAIEINPRFQATVDTVEMATGCNLFKMHLDACRGILPNLQPRATQFAARSILFADRDITVHADLKHLSPIVADIPLPGTFFEKDQAIASIYGTGPTRGEALEMLDKNITTVQQYLR
jgi:predicted ATP-grasp superfamily ATP-dependent carboligase